MFYLLIPFSILFRFIVFIRNYLYQNAFLKQKRLSCPVICVGNLTTGGTGKTPWVQLMSHYFSSLDKKVTIVSRGYTGDFSGVLQVTDEMDPRKCGDEPLWLKKNTQAQVYVGKSRFEAGSEALKAGNTDMIVLDDGFQHRQLFRDFNMVLLDASAPEKQYHMLPGGRLREPFSQLSRAQVVIINKCNYANDEQVHFLESIAKKYVADEKVFRANFVFDRWYPVIDSLEKELKVSDVALSCGVGNPKAFFDTVEGTGLKIKRKFVFPDHYYWKPSDIERMTYHMKSENLKDLVITEKDGVKLLRYKKHLQEMGIQLWICKMKIEFQSGEKQFFSLIDQVGKS